MDRGTLFIGCVIGGIAASSSAETVTVTASRDATLYEFFDGSVANGAGQYFFAGKNNQNRARRGLLYFDIAAMVPEGATITDASLTLNMSQTTAGARDVGIYRALTAWTSGLSDASEAEGSGTSALVNDATWLWSSYDGNGGGATWNTAGGDFATTASANITTQALGLYTWNSAGLLADVRAFATNANLNLGWFVIGDESTFGTARRFDSADSGELGGIVPKLQIEFTTVPAPGALATLALAGLGACRRRR